MIGTSINWILKLTFATTDPPNAMRAMRIFKWSRKSKQEIQGMQGKGVWQYVEECAVADRQEGTARKSADQEVHGQ